MQAKAQQFGGFPPRTKWQQIDTDTARIIYTGKASAPAQRIATLIHRMAADTPTALGSRLRKINVVLHGQTTLANGYVGLAPFRSEYYLLPGGNIFDFGNLPWAENLAIHEYRHVQQYANFRNGLSKLAYYAFGERGQSLVNAMAVPDWFWEGDAVHAETALTPQGRGRMPFFLSGYNSLFAEGKNYSWMKLRNGSFKDYVPNHYQLGYLLVNYGYMKYGADFWEKVTKDASSFKSIIYPFQHAVKKHAGVPFSTFRKNALEYYNSQVDKTGTGKKSTKEVTSFFFPQYIAPDSLIYLKSAYNQVDAFYVKDNKGEHRIARKGIGPEDWFAYRNGLIAYTAFSTDPRWSLVNYNDIVLLDVPTGKEHRITTRQRYYTPDIAPSPGRLIAVHVDDSLRYQLHLLDQKGNVLQHFNAGEGELFVNPKFIDDSSVVVGIRSTDSRMRLVRLHLDGRQDLLLPPTTFTIGLPYVQKDTVYFTAGFNGNDDIYALSLGDKKVFQLTSGVTGRYYPSVFGDTLTYSVFTTKGLQIERAGLQGLQWRSRNIEGISSGAANFPVTFSQTEFIQTPSRRFSEKRYPKSTRLFNFHSWSPDYTDPEFTFSIYSNNILNTFTNTLFYRYNQNETSHTAGFNSSYGGWYPMINAGLEYTFDRNIFRSDSSLHTNQMEARIGYNIPLNLTKGKTAKGLNFGTNLAYTRTLPTGFFKDSFAVSSLVNLHHFISFSQQLPRAIQQIFPKFGYSIALNYRHALNRKNYQALGGFQLALPSFGNHSIVLSGAYQEVDTNNFVFSNRFSNARGYPDIYNPRMYRASANYHFPIVYPDFGFANIVYLRRIRGNVFYDWSEISSSTKQSSTALRSTGVEVFFETNWWNSLPLTFGIRYSNLLDNHKFRSLGSNQWEFTLPIDLIPD
jgi:hypothetical protein